MRRATDEPIARTDALLALRAAEAGDWDGAFEALTDLVRYGKTISADTSSKIQEAVDHLNSAQEAHGNAVKALKFLVELGMASGDVIPADGLRPTNDLQKKGNVSRGTDLGVEFFQTGPRLPSQRDPNFQFRG